MKKILINPHDLMRNQLIEALRPITPPRAYQALTRDSTAILRAALAYWQSTNEERLPVQPEGVRGLELMFIVHDEAA
jgi:hypothetical protein